MIGHIKRWGIAQFWSLTGREARNRRELSSGHTGLRILTFHDSGPDVLPWFCDVIKWCTDHYGMADPETADSLCTGRYSPKTSDEILVTFDDGYASNFQAAQWLAARGIKAIFFVVPSLIGRNGHTYAEYHASRGVRPYPLARDGQPGLTHSQLDEMRSMGHRIAAHNFAHRDLAALHQPEELDYEIGQALDQIAEWTGQPCRDFAYAFGQPSNLSDEALEYLLARDLRVYACHRGLNVPGGGARFLLRHDCRQEHPMAFTRAAIRGAADHHLADRIRYMASRVGPLPRPAEGRSGNPTASEADTTRPARSHS